LATTRLTQEEQEAILYWPEIADIPIIPADTKNKKIWLDKWQEIDFTNVDFRAKLANGDYDNGIAIRTGKTLSGKYYSIALDFDGWDAVVEWFGTWEQVIALSKQTVVEWHQDKCKIHVIFLSNSPIQNRRIHIKDAFLEIRCEKNVLFSSPSIHKEGNPYAALGTSQLAILSEQKILELKSKISSICEDYMSDADKEQYDQWLDLPTTILGINQGRHDATKFKINRYYWKYSGEWLNLSDDQRFERAWSWHIDHCKPPRPREEFDRLCEWARDKFRAKRDELHDRVRDERRREQAAQEFDKSYAFSVYHDNVQASLKEHMWTEIGKNPNKWIVADSKMKVIYKAHQYEYEITAKHGNEEVSEKVCKLSIDNIIIRCIPINVIKHENPLDFLNIQTNYTVRFKDTIGKTLAVARKSLMQIMEYLKDNGYVMHGYGATEALSAIITAFREDSKLQVEKSVDFQGYYYCDGDIQRSGVAEDKHPQRTKEECIIATDFLEKWSEFYIYKGIDRRDVVAMVIKWTIIAPFNFVLKQLTRKYMNGVSFSGERDGGKSAMSEAMLEIHGNFTDKSVTEQSIYDLSAGSANTDAKFGNAVSHTTYPVAFSEFGRVESYGRDEKLVETFKNAIDRLICRHGRHEGKYDFPFLSLSPLIINGNPFISRKGEILKRLHTVKYSQEDRHGKEDPRTIEYNDLMQKRRHELRILGDWTINYIWDNRQELLLSKRYDAYQLMDIVIKKFYEFAGVEFPEWLGRWILETALDELDVDEEGIIRAILFKHIHDVLRQNAHLLDTRNMGDIALADRIRLCLQHDLLSFIRRVPTSIETYNIDSSVLMLFEDRLPDMTLKRLGEKMGFTHQKERDRWVLRCSNVQLMSFIDGGMY
jgi:hypothetical protein